MNFVRAFATVLSLLLLGGPALSGVGQEGISSAGGGGGSVAMAQHVIATKTHIASSGPGALQVQTRTRHRATDNISALQIVYGNWYVSQSTFNEVGGGSTATITASIEYPAGTCTQITFGGIATGTLASGNNLISDSTAPSVTIPNGSFFYIRMHISTPGGTIATETLPSGFPGQVTDIANGEGVTYGTTIVDQTLTCGAVTDTDGLGQIWAGPAAIIGTTAAKSVYLAGDSRQLGLEDTFVDNSGDTGEVARSIGPSFGYINGGVSGLELHPWLTGNTQQVALFKYVTSVIFEAGEADIVNLSRTAVQVEADMAAAWALVPSGVQAYQTTLLGESTSTDSWATTTNQTTVATNSVTNTVNASLRGGTAPPGGYFDVASVLMTTLTSGIWIASPNPPYTKDGIHEQAIGNVLIHAQGVIAPTRIH